MAGHSATGDWSGRPVATATDYPIIPGYEILDELGRGGMGVVYKARQVSLHRLVALKLIRNGALASPQERARFRTEAEAAARLQHPNVVQIYEVGEHQGQLYFAMELVEYGSLDRYLAGQPQPARQAAELLRTLAGAVQHAHAHNVVHRDLKPGNILLQRAFTAENAEDADVKPKWPFSASSAFFAVNTIVKITDFGLAKCLDNQSTAWTHDGVVLGTASYMAPEQAAGRVREIGPAADIYALGAILYEVLTGRPPFQADSWSQTVEQVLHDEPARPAHLHADVPRDLETICLKCLEKEPGRRYGTAGELAADLGRFLDGQPLAAVPLGAGERLARLAARDGYQLAGEIGRGPRSIVYRAFYGPLNQPVALKVFSTGVGTRPEWDARLERGAGLWAMVAHPHVVLIHRTGWWDNAPYVAAEYVAHGSLAAKLAGRPYPVRHALRVLEQLAEVICYVHRQGVVHGNLKPSNVLFAADEIPRIVDFRPTGGLCHGPLPADDSAAAGLGYLAPELVRNPGAEPRPYTDVYGLGIILYELLTGRPPFGKCGAPDTLEQVRSDEPEPPSRLNPEVTPPLEAFCLRCLRKDPWRRYARAYDMLTRLRYFRDNPGGDARPDKGWPPRRPPGIS